MNDEDDQLLSAIEASEEAAYGRLNDELSTDRSQAIEYYLGRPFGNEVEGRSQVVSRDVYDTIESIKPSLFRIFTAGEEIIRFEPTGPEDEEQAQQETDYVNYVIQQKNDWGSIVDTWFTDALLTKNAYALAYWHEEKDTTKETYRGLTEDQLALLAQDESIEIVGYNQYPGPTGMMADVQLMKTGEYGCVRIEVLPPERCLVSQHTSSTSVQGSDFFEYWDFKTISELREMGLDVEDDISDDGGSDYSTEDNARDQYGERFNDDDSLTNDPSMRRVRVRMVWKKFDYDGDGLAEYRYCIVVGKTILRNDECSRIPVGCVVPTRLPHRHPGLSVADMVMDIQLIKSTIIRQTLDNLYLANNGRNAVSDKVNLDDMLTSRPGGIVRVDGIPAQHIMPFQHAFIGERALQMVEYMDSVRQNRVGVNNYFTGTDDNAINKTASGIAQLTSAASQRVEMIARIFADGVKELFSVVHELTLKHARQAEVVRLRGTWATIDPQQWKKRKDMTIAVGLGTGNKEVMGANLMNILKIQEFGQAIGIAGPKEIYATAVELTKAYGFPSPDKFWMDPEKNPQPPKPDPKMLEKAMQEIEQGKQQLQSESQKIKDEGTKLEVEKIDFEAQKKLADMEFKYRQAQETMRKEVDELDPEGSTKALEEARETISQYEAFVENLRQPKQIIKDATGLAVAVKQGELVHEIIRGKDGRPSGLQLRA